MAYYTNSSSASGSHPLDLSIEEIDLSKSKSYQESQTYYYNKLNGDKIDEINLSDRPKKSTNKSQRPEVPARPKKYMTPQPDSVDSKSPTKVLFNPIQFKANPGKRQAPRILPNIPDPPSTCLPVPEIAHLVGAAASSSIPAPLASPEVFAVKSKVSPLKNVSPPKTLPLNKQVFDF